jgi:hypothetical protein
MWPFELVVLRFSRITFYRSDLRELTVPRILSVQTELELESV